jgi:catechol 2,3-dioxygenase-like lactoylglutathione lyase family enzyme
MAQESNWRIDHTGIGVAEIRKSAQFYDAALGALGLRPVVRITKTFGAATGADDPELGGVG